MNFKRRNIIFGGIFIAFILIGILVYFGASHFLTTPENQDTKTDETNKSDKTNNKVPVKKDNETTIASLRAIENTINTYGESEKKIPLPANHISIYIGKEIVAYVGRIDSSFYDSLNLSENTESQPVYMYILSYDQKKYKIIAPLDDTSISNETFQNKKVYSVGTMGTDFLASWNLLDLSQEKINLLDNVVRKQLNLPSLKSCKDIKDIQPQLNIPSGIYTVELHEKNTPVFCDMQTDGGGWTLFYANNGHPNSVIKKSYMEMRDAMKNANTDLSNYDDPYLAGLLDYSEFTKNESREVLIRNRAGDKKKWIRFTFSESSVLNWALGTEVLGKTDSACFKLPHGGTWSIVNNDKTIHYQNLSEIMNHRGTNWGVSHEKFLCNGYNLGVNPHIAFYSVSDVSNGGRARSNDGIGGIWGGENEYRYFIR